MATKQGFLMYYTKGIAIRTKVSVRSRESGRLSEVAVKRGSSTVAYPGGIWVFEHPPHHTPFAFKPKIDFAILYSWRWSSS